MEAQDQRGVLGTLRAVGYAPAWGVARQAKADALCPLRFGRLRSRGRGDRQRLFRASVAVVA